ncbi:MAG: hypothetical protein IJC64_03260 [Clostridia bacterium]|nr:hypothetical protein [Clostridia bacterium]
MNEDKMPQYIKRQRLTGQKKTLFIIIAIAIGAFVICGALVALLEGVSGDKTQSGGEIETVDPWLLDETKPEGFDIMEYDEYLKLDRTVYRHDRHTGVKVSVAEDEYDMYGEAFEVVCLALMAVRDGDADAYNGYMGDKALKKSGFTQQQIYAIEISTYSQKNMTDPEGADYTEFVFEVRYRIHENNGTYRNTIDSDETRPQYFVVNDRSGEMLVMDIIEKSYSK